MKRLFPLPFALVLLQAASFGQTRPNVVVIVADDVGFADCSFTHELFMAPADRLPEVNTPHIDALAHEGIIFANGYVNGNVCSPTRAAFMLGRYQQRVGVYTAGEGGDGMPVLKQEGTDITPINPIFPAFLKDAAAGLDYECGAFGKWHLGLDQVYANVETDSRVDTSYDHTDGSGAGYGSPTNGPLTTSPTGGGSPWHPVNRGFDTSFNFMGRGAHSYWDPNELYGDLQKSGDLGDRGGMFEEPIASWDSLAIDSERTPANYLTNQLTDAACSFIQNKAGGSQPFFCYLAYNAAHSPAQVPYHMDAAGNLEPLGSHGKRYATSDPDWFADPIWFYENFPNMEKPAYLGAVDIDEVRRSRSITLAMVQWLDRGVAKVVQTLKDEGVYDNTIIVFFSDNGGATQMRASNKPLRGNKATHWEGGVRVPFSLHWPRFLAGLPSGRQGGRVIDAPVIAMDILPTVLDAANLPAPAGPYACDGTSLLPLIRGDVDRVHDYLFWTDAVGEGAVRLFRWKLFIQGGVSQLFDLKNDVSETTDVSALYPGVADHLYKRWLQWREEVAGNDEGTTTETLTSTATEDAYVDQSQPDSNFGAGNRLRIEKTANERRAYLKFDLSGITQEIVSSKLFLYSFDCEGPISVSVVADDSWTESGITWNNRPALGDEISTAVATAGQWVGLDVSSHIAGNGVYSLAITRPSGASQAVRSRESADKPRLEITVRREPNRKPAFNSDPFIESDATVDQPYSLSIAGDATDADAGDHLRFLKIDGPDWLTIGSDGTLSGTPTASHAGLNRFIVVVEDDKDGSDLAELRIQVVPATFPPSGVHSAWNYYI